MTDIDNNRVDFGNAETFTEHYQRYFSLLKYFALRYMDDPDMVYDVVQEIFVKLWNNKKQFENEIAVRVFLYHSVRNSCLNKIRDQQTHTRIQSNIEIDDTQESFINNIIEAEIFVIVKQGFDELPESIKRVYKMSLDGMSHAEIADVLKISINTIKKHKNTANHFLRDKFKDIFTILLSLS